MVNTAEGLSTGGLTAGAVRRTGWRDVLPGGDLTPAGSVQGRRKGQLMSIYSDIRDAAFVREIRDNIVTNAL